MVRDYREYMKKEVLPLLFTHVAKRYLRQHLPNDELIILDLFGFKTLHDDNNYLIWFADIHLPQDDYDNDELVRFNCWAQCLTPYAPPLRTT
jgi:hypothetical protein